MSITHIPGPGSPSGSLSLTPTPLYPYRSQWSNSYTKILNDSSSSSSTAPDCLSPRFRPMCAGWAPVIESILRWKLPGPVNSGFRTDTCRWVSFCGLKFIKFWFIVNNYIWLFFYVEFLRPEKLRSRLLLIFGWLVLNKFNMSLFLSYKKRLV